MSCREFSDELSDGMHSPIASVESSSSSSSSASLSSSAKADGAEGASSAPAPGRLSLLQGLFGRGAGPSEEAAAGSKADVAAFTPAAFCASDLDALLGHNDWPALKTELVRWMDGAREPRAVNWCVERGYRQGHVLPLYMLVRNLLSFHDRGAVPLVETVTFGLRCALLLLLRVTQDVHACMLDMAKTDVEGVFTAFRGKLAKWVSAWDSRSLSAVGATAGEVEAWSRARVQLPLPTWATEFRVTCLTTFSFGAPSKKDTEAFQRNRTIDSTREQVARAFLSYVRTCASWDKVFVADIVDLTTCKPEREKP